MGTKLLHAFVQGGICECERRIEVYVKMHKKKLGGRAGGGIRVDVNEEVIFFFENAKKKSGGQVEGSGWM